MKVLLNEEVTKLGVTEFDVKCMLKAAGKDLKYQDVYEPTTAEMAKLANDAYKAEYAKSRHVDKWVALSIKFDDLLK
jgi:hypothetical protein